jgi:PhoPQ-activated pathogenicity-related protein
MRARVSRRSAGWSLLGWVVILSFGSSSQLAVPRLSAQDEQPQAGNPALREYVETEDPSYAWEVVRTVEGNPATTFTVKLTSQTWRTEQDVDQPVWQHWLVIVKPEQVRSDKAFLMIGGGSNDSDPPQRPDDAILRMAEATQSVVAELRMIPNQALVFHQDGTPRKEDDLIGYCWDQFIQTGDATWLPRLPMVKSVVRAMDCMTELLGSEQGGEVPLRSFVVAGASKRGWTTWMSPVADSRIEAIVPIVIDVLNVGPSMEHHAQVYGFWAAAIGNYYQHGIMQRWGHPRLEELYRIVDPYYHLDRLELPKFIVNGAGDQFFLPDSSQFYWDQLPGEKLIRYVPNADHSLRGSDALESILAYYQRILQGIARPRYDWTFEEDGSIRVTTPDRPTKVTLWRANNPNSRDFRLMTIGPAFQGIPVSQEEEGVYVARAESPSEGWSAYFVELTFESPGCLPLKVTTAVRVTPDELPHAGVDLREVPYELELEKAP